MKKNYILPDAKFEAFALSDIIAISPVGIGENEDDIIVSVNEW